MSGSNDTPPKSKTKLPKHSENSSAKSNGLQFVDDERKTVLGIFDILLNGDDDINARKRRCTDAMERLFGLVYKRRLSANLDDGIDIHPIVRAGINEFDVSIEDLRSGKRSESLVKARKWIAKRLRKQGMSYPQIGKILNRSHTSIMSLLGARR